MGYPKDLLASRAVVKPGLWAVIPKDGLVNNVIPGLTGCRVSIVASPKMGAGFAEYVVDAEPGAHTTTPFGAQEGIETFLYLVSGQAELTVGEKREIFSQSGYAYAPPGVGISFRTTDVPTKILLYKQRYIPYAQSCPDMVMGSAHDIPYRIYDGMENVHIKDFLPTQDLAYDMNMHILSFAPGGCHPFVETHVQEHGAYILSGEGMYLMDDVWLGIKREDFMWFGAYCPQAAYGVGTEEFSYIYSKDCNRDVQL